MPLIAILLHALKDNFSKETCDPACADNELPGQPAPDKLIIMSEQPAS